MLRTVLVLGVLLATFAVSTESVQVRIGEPYKRQLTDPPEEQTANDDDGEVPRGYVPKSKYELDAGPAEESISAAPVRSQQQRIESRPIKHMPKTEHLKDGLVHLVDHVGDRYLFRGNLPKTTGKDGKPRFAVDALNSTFKALAPQLNDNFFLVVLCLLDPKKNEPGQDEIKHIRMEQRFFAEHPHTGMVVNWPTRGTELSPFQEQSFRACLRQTHMSPVCEQILYSKQTDMLESRVRKMRSLMHSAPQALLAIGRSPEQALPQEIEDILRQVERTSRDIVIYFHCEHGVDRTGETAAAYSMRYLKMPYQDAIHQANTIAIGLPMQIQYKNQLQWYCEYLFAQGMVPNGCHDREGEIPARPE